MKRSSSLLLNNPMNKQFVSFNALILLAVDTVGWMSGRASSLSDTTLSASIPTFPWELLEDHQLTQMNPEKTKKDVHMCV